MGVEAGRRDAHTGAHDRDALALVVAGEAEHVAYGVELHDLLKVGIGNELGAQGSPGSRMVSATSAPFGAICGVLTASAMSLSFLVRKGGVFAPSLPGFI